MKFDKEKMRLYAITDRHWLNGRSLKEVVKESLDGGVTFLQLQGHMGYEMISRITLNNGKVSTELLSERELGENDEYFDNGFPLPGSSVTDKSYLN